MLGLDEIIQTIRMIQNENLDIRTVTMGISLHDCVDSDPDSLCRKIHRKITGVAGRLVSVAEQIEREYGIPIVNKRIAVTPLALVAGGQDPEAYLALARTLDQAARDVGVNFIGGFSALVHKGFTGGDRLLIETIPDALATTERVCASVNVATTKAGINMDAIYLMGRTIKETAARTADRDGLGCAKLVVFANAPEDNPFMAGAYHGVGEPECVLNVGVSGPGVVKNAVAQLPDADLGALAEQIKKMAFKVTRMGELVGRETARRLDVPFGIVDLSLAPTPAVGDSVAEIIESMGVEVCGAPGTTAALALLNDAVKKGGAMASSYVGGLSGAFIPVSEDAGMIRAVESGALSLDKLEAMTAVCSVGIDMVALPGDTTAETIAALIADEIAIGVVNHKTTGVRLIPVPGKREGDFVEFGGLLGRAPVMPVNRFGAAGFVRRGGRIPAPVSSLTN
ncbi:MAG: PFL family protein [Candidatus Desulforudis sp.]|nr:PFL family protein [Desulforudis sp.]